MAHFLKQCHSYSKRATPPNGVSVTPNELMGANYIHSAAVSFCQHFLPSHSLANPIPCYTYVNGCGASHVEKVTMAILSKKNDCPPSAAITSY